ncbi:MAG: four helix bundle protein [Pirellulales bacterium]
MRDFRDLQVWRKAHQLTLDLYRTTAAFPKEELYGLTSQIRRAAASIAANIAEGCGRDGEAELARFCRIAAGSASEVEYHILLAHDLGFLNQQAYAAHTQSTTELKRMLTAFISRLQPQR